MAPQPSSNPSETPSSQPSPTFEPTQEPSWIGQGPRLTKPPVLHGRPWTVPWPPLRCPQKEIGQDLLMKCYSDPDETLYYKGSIFEHTHDHFACIQRLLVDPLSCAEIWCPYYPKIELCAKFHQNSYEDDDYYSKFIFNETNWEPGDPIWPWETLRPQGETTDDF